MTPNQRAFLDMLAMSEIGALLSLSDNGYNVIVGSTPSRPILFHNYADHPRQKVWIAKINDYSTAAGRYQLLSKYFDIYKKQLNLPDFSPASQDAIALQQIRECRALGDIDSGHLALAVIKCKRIWASLPGAGYNQHENDYAFLQGAYLKAGGTLA